MREQKKEERRRAILQAAGTLIRETSSTDFSMRELARRAGFSLATTYNLIGSKATVLYALLNQCMDSVDLARLSSLKHGDPIEHVFQASDAAVTIYTSDPDFYRPLLRFLLGVPDSVNRPLFMDRAFRYWWAAVQTLAQRGSFQGMFAPQALARDLQIFFAGTIDFWVHNELDSEQFKAQIRMGVAMRLLALGLDRYSARLKNEIANHGRLIDPLLPEISRAKPHGDLTEL
jgi:AcrR family transcriptional regulator